MRSTSTLIFTLLLIASCQSTKNTTAPIVELEQAYEEEPLVKDEVAPEKEKESVFESASYRKVSLAGNLTDPMEMDITSDGRVFVTEWAGAIKIFEPGARDFRVVGWLPVEKVIEDGLHGLALDPNFDSNGWIYIYYSTRLEEQAINRLSRFVYDGKMIDIKSEKAVLEVPVQRLKCCHSGGSVQFDGSGNLWLSTGDNSGPFEAGKEHTMEEARVGDQGRTAMNTNDLRGKILRITPQADGSYTIPEGNLFEADDEHRGEIFTMGHRNPYRIGIDKKTEYVYWGDVGSSEQNDEFNEAREPGFFGWPYWDGQNDPYEPYIPAGVEKAEEYRIVEKPVNPSRFNTGARELPPAQPAMISYTKGESEEWPLLQAGGATPMSGPVFRYDARSAHVNAMPKEFDGMHLIYEWMRNWILMVPVDNRDGAAELQPFLPEHTFSSPMDVEVSPDGRLYVLEWGESFWGSNADAQLSRLDYIGDGAEPVMSSARVIAPAVSISEPANGSFFDFDQSFSYSANNLDQALNDEIVVTAYTGFDTTELPLESKTGQVGQLTISKKYTHNPDIHYVDRFAKIVACPKMGDRCSSVKLHPRTKEAEHASSREKVQRQTYSARPASYHWGSTNLTVIKARGGSMLGFDPMNLDAVSSVTLRFRPLKESSIRIKWTKDATDIAGGVLNSESGQAAVPFQAGYLADIVPDPVKDSGLGLLRDTAYDNWREVTLAVSEDHGAGQLDFLIDSEESGWVVEIDWIRFNR